jgi:hypothetical protein
MTAAPAFLLTIPIANFVSAYQAELAQVFITFLIAVWRLSLLVWFLKKTACLPVLRSVCSLFLPMALIVNLIVLADKFVSPVGMMGHMHRELRKLNPSAKPGQQGIRTYKHVTSGATAWLTRRGMDLAEQNDFHLPKLKIGGEPRYSDTIHTPNGSVEVYTDWTIGGSVNQVPPGYAVIDVKDPIYAYRNPMAKLLATIAPFCFYASLPVFVMYLIFMFRKPKIGDGSNF